MTTNEYAVFLDVDGVINSLNHLYQGGKVKFDYHTQPHVAGQYTVWVPEYMGPLVQAIEASSDLYWLTTWREKANEHISPILNISSSTKVIDDGTNIRTVSWKYNACLDIAKQLSEDGKTVLWIEDFGGRHYDKRHKQYVTYVDTDARNEGVFLPQHLPADFMSHIIKNGGYTGPTHVAAPNETGKPSAYAIYRDTHGVTA
jgi:hypothetical protein